LVHVTYTLVHDWCMNRVRTIIEIEDTYVQAIMNRYGLRTKTEAVDLALRHLAGQPMTARRHWRCGTRTPSQSPRPTPSLTALSDSRAWCVTLRHASRCGPPGSSADGQGAAGVWSGRQPGGDVGDDRRVHVLGRLVLCRRGRAAAGEEQVVVGVVDTDRHVRAAGQGRLPARKVLGDCRLIVAAALEDEDRLAQRRGGLGRYSLATVKPRSCATSFPCA
jgi:Arc/MetJ family transcription regulator